MNPENLTLADALARLATLDAERRGLIEELVHRGFRGRNLVADYGELIAAAYYGADRAAPSQPGYDLQAPLVGRVQVKTLRDSPTYRRTSMGAMREPYDTLFAIRLNVGYEVVRAIEVPRPVLEQLYPHGTRTSWTKKLDGQPGVNHIVLEQLRAAAREIQLSTRGGEHQRVRLTEAGFEVFPPTASGILEWVRTTSPAPLRPDVLEHVRSLIASGHIVPEDVQRLIDAGYQELADADLDR